MADDIVQLVQAQGDEQLSPTTRKFLLIISCILLALGNCGGPQLMRLYFVHGGNRLWFTSWLETGSAVIGLLTGLDDYLYAIGVKGLPLSTLSLIIASHLAFTAFFAVLLVKQKFTFYSVNAIVLLVVGSAVLGLNTNSDRPAGVSKSEYLAGFFMTIAAAALYGLVLPAVELMYKKCRQVVTYGVVMEVQLVMCFFATLLCTVGMYINKDFQAIPREAKEYDLGEMKYYIVVVWNAILWQCFFLGAIGVIFCASCLLSGIIIAVLLPFTEILAVIIFNEKFTPEKGVALVLSLWGFVSYFYGEIKHTKKMEPEAVVQRSHDIEWPQIVFTYMRNW